MNFISEQFKKNKELISILGLLATSLGVIIQISFLIQVDGIIFFSWNQLLNDFIIFFFFFLISTIIILVCFRLISKISISFIKNNQVIARWSFIIFLSFIIDFLDKSTYIGALYNLYLNVSLYLFFILLGLFFIYKLYTKSFNGLQLFIGFLLLFIIIPIKTIEIPKKIKESVAEIYGYEIIYDGTKMNLFYLNGEYAFVKNKNNLVIPVDMVEYFIKEDQ